MIRHEELYRKLMKQKLFQRGFLSMEDTEGLNGHIQVDNDAEFPFEYKRKDKWDDLRCPETNCSFLLKTSCHTPDGAHIRKGNASLYKVLCGGVAKAVVPM